jgi:hypothetical protein
MTPIAMPELHSVCGIEIVALLRNQRFDQGFRLARPLRSQF